MKFVYFVMLCCSFTLMHAQEFKIQMHSHNDYEQEFPLSTALSYNFKSIEVDVFEYQDDIIVSHDDDNLHQKPTLKELYLEPLSNYPFKENQTIYLLIDLKSKSNTILWVLHELLDSYAHLFKTREGDSQHAPIQVILSGSVDTEFVIANDSFSYFFVDGRPNDLSKDYDSHLMPLISTDFEDLLCWKSTKRLTKSTIDPVLKLIKATHQEGKIIRFWNTPETPKLWDLLIALKVDLIGVDNLEQFVTYTAKFNQ